MHSQSGLQSSHRVNPSLMPTQNAHRVLDASVPKDSSGHGVFGDKVHFYYRSGDAPTANRSSTPSSIPAVRTPTSLLFRGVLYGLLCSGALQGGLVAKQAA